MRATLGRRSSRTGLVIAGVAIAAAVVLVGCTSGASTSADAGLPAASAAATAQAAPEADSAGREASGAAGANQSAEAPAAAGDAATQAPADLLPTALVDGSKVIKTADLSMRLTVEPVAATADSAADREANAAARAAAIAQAAAAVRGIASTAGGFQSAAEGGGSQMTISLRVPAEQYDQVVDKLTAIGEVTNRTESSQDVTAQVVDVNSRVESMTASVARVRALLAQATSIADVISIESELSVREANLESLQQQQAALTGQVALSTISLSLTAVTDTPATEPAPQDNGFVAGIKAGWSALLGFFGWIGGAVGALLPFLPLLAAAGLIVWWLVRRLRRRPSRSAAPQPPVGTPTPAPAQAPQEARPEAEPVGAGSGGS